MQNRLRNLLTVLKNHDSFSQFFFVKNSIFYEIFIDFKIIYGAYRFPKNEKPDPKLINIMDIKWR